MNQLTTIASLPGSGSGCMSALPAEKPSRRLEDAVRLDCDFGRGESTTIIATWQNGEISVWEALGEFKAALMRSWAKEE